MGKKFREYASTLTTPIAFGNGANYTEIAEDGSIMYYGDAMFWDDKLGSLVGRRLDTSSGRIDYNYFNGGVDYQANTIFDVTAKTDVVVIRHQINHKFLVGVGAVAHTHLHWKQQSTDVPNWLMGWLKIKNGEAGALQTDFSNYTLATIDTDAFVYSSGLLDQISEFPPIDMSDMNVSDFLITVLWRDTTNVSGLFAGADPSGLRELATDLDSHLKINSPGSREEYVK